MKLNSLKDAVSLKSPINIMVIVLSISLISEILYAIHTKVIHASGVSLVPTHNDRHKYLKYLWLLGSRVVAKLKGKCFSFSKCKKKHKSNDLLHVESQNISDNRNIKRRIRSR